MTEAPIDSALRWGSPQRMALTRIVLCVVTPLRIAMALTVAPPSPLTGTRVGLFDGEALWNGFDDESCEQGSDGMRG